MKNTNDKNKRDKDVKHEASVVSDEFGAECYYVTYDNSNNWILDTRCSYHMCLNKKWFTSYKDINGATVLMDNEHGCKTVGIVTIRIKMHDGIVRTLMDVRHVPDLRKNIIYLGLIDENEILKVVNGSLVVMKGICHGNWYNLIGNIVIGDVADKTLTKIPHFDGHYDHWSEMMGNLLRASGRWNLIKAENCLATQAIDLSKLWHVRYGHLSHKGLQILQDKEMVQGVPKLTSSTTTCCDYLNVKQQEPLYQSRVHGEQASIWRYSTLTFVDQSLLLPKVVSDTFLVFERVGFTFWSKSQKLWIVSKLFKNVVENETGLSIKCLRTDRGGEYTSTDFNSFCEENGIKREKKQDSDEHENPQDILARSSEMDIPFPEQMPYSTREEHDMTRGLEWSKASMRMPCSCPCSQGEKKLFNVASNKFVVSRDVCWRKVSNGTRRKTMGNKFVRNLNGKKAQRNETVRDNLEGERKTWDIEHSEDIREIRETQGEQCNQTQRRP
ncbi:hypothetical protein V2J09_003789 [Rumex salicifolius]